jgi:TM2 domain-containing membrane protein YozV
MLLAILFPFLSMMVNGHIFKGIICLILQCLVIGWIPAAIWACVSLSSDRADKRHQQVMQAIQAAAGVKDIQG